MTIDPLSKQVCPALPGKVVFRAVAFVMALLLRLPAAEPVILRFDLPSDTLERSIKRFAAQSGLEVLIPEALGEIRTNPVRGEMTSRQALEDMLAGTGLAVLQDPKSGALAIRPNPANGDTASPKPARDEPSPQKENANRIDTPTPMKRNRISLLGAWLALVLGSNAQPPPPPQATGVIEGRVSNPATGEYLGNAEVRVNGTDLIAVTSSEGRYRIPGVPPGNFTVTASYTGYRSAAAPVTVTAGQVSRQDFELQSALQPADVRTVTLDRFTVTAEREGNARAIMEQRSAMTVKEVVTTDTFGPIADGNIQNALQYLPGVNLTSGLVFLNGMHEKYGAFMIDGVRMSGATRAMEPRSYSSHGADTIEFNKTNSADMDADAPAGSVNLRSKSAFQRSGRYVSWEVYVIHSVYNPLTLGKVDGPNDGQSRPLKPSAVVDYSDVFLNGKLGIALNYGETHGDSTGFGFNAGFVNTAYDTTPTPTHPSPVVIANVTWGGGGGSNLRRGGAMNAEYKFTPNLSSADSPCSPTTVNIAAAIPSSPIGPRRR